MSKKIQKSFTNELEKVSNCRKECSAKIIYCLHWGLKISISNMYEWSIPQCKLSTSTDWCLSCSNTWKGQFLQCLYGTDKTQAVWGEQQVWKAFHLQLLLKHVSCWGCCVLLWLSDLCLQKKPITFTKMQWCASSFEQEKSAAWAGEEAMKKPHIWIQLVSYARPQAIAILC